MATVTKTIGTSSRDYSTIETWESDLDEDVYDINDDAVGEIYNDSVFDEGTITIDTEDRLLDSVLLTVAVSDRHDGTAGSGARIVSAGSQNRIILKPRDNPDGNWMIFEWLEVDNNGEDAYTLRVHGGDNFNVPWIRNCIIHDGMRQLLTAPARDCRVTNTLFYGGAAIDNGSMKGIDLDADREEGGFYNNTVYGIRNDNAGAIRGLYVRSDDADGVVKNNIVMGTASSGGGTVTDIWFRTSPTNVDSDYNMSSDASADDAGGSNNLIDKTSGNQFVSTVVGSEDLHLKSGSDAIDAGVDLGTTLPGDAPIAAGPAGAEIDIDGRDRDAEGDTWSLGAHQFVAATAIPEALNTYQQMRVH